MATVDTAVLDTAGGSECVSSRDCDGDGYPSTRVGGDDCDDEAAAVNPGAPEACGNLADDDCDGATDEGCAAEGLPDPGGLAWICGTAAPDAAWSLLTAAIVAALWRRR
jgi:hypothetical protein